MLSPLSVKLAPAGAPSACSATGSPSSSEAVTTNVMSVPSSPAVAGEMTIGSWFTPVTVMVVDAEPLSAFDAVNVTV